LIIYFYLSLNQSQNSRAMKNRCTKKNPQSVRLTSGIDYGSILIRMIDQFSASYYIRVELLNKQLRKMRSMISGDIQIIIEAVRRDIAIPGNVRYGLDG